MSKIYQQRLFPDPRDTADLPLKPVPQPAWIIMVLIGCLVFTLAVTALALNGLALKQVTTKGRIIGTGAEGRMLVEFTMPEGIGLRVGQPLRAYLLRERKAQATVVEVEGNRYRALFDDAADGWSRSAQVDIEVQVVTKLGPLLLSRLTPHKL